MKRNKGITLIALVITIIILIILAAIAINTVFGENGLILRAQEAKFKTEVSGIKDLVEVKRLELEISNQLQQSGQRLSDYLSTLSMSEYIGSNKLVIDRKGKLAYDPDGDFSNDPQKTWLHQIGIYAAEPDNGLQFPPWIESARLELEVYNSSKLGEVLSLKLYIDNDLGLIQFLREACSLILSNELYIEEWAIEESGYNDIEELLQSGQMRSVVSEMLKAESWEIEKSMLSWLIDEGFASVDSSPDLGPIDLNERFNFFPSS